MHGFASARNGVLLNVIIGMLCFAVTFAAVSGFALAPSGQRVSTVKWGIASVAALALDWFIVSAIWY